MAEASSESRGPVVAKILIDLLEYKKLLKSNDLKTEYEQKLKALYKSSAEVKKERPGPSNQYESVNENPVQIGQGEIDLEEKIRRLVREEFLNINKGDAQIGGSDLAQELTRPLSPKEDLKDHANLTGFTVIKKSDENDPIEEGLLLKNIPENNKNSARRILELFNDNSNNITFDLNGVVYVDKNSLPNSNIFSLLPELFKEKPDLNLPGFLELVSEIINLGHGYLLNKNYLKGILRLNNSGERDELHDYLKPDKSRWFYLGM